MAFLNATTILTTLVFALSSPAFIAQSGFHPNPSAEWAKVSLSDTTGKVHTAVEWEGKRAVVLLFVTTDCPLSNGYVPEFNRLAVDYAGKGVVFYAVQGDATTTTEEVQRHVKEFGYGFPYLLDPQESLATLTGATTTPEAVVLSPGGELLYLGRIDNRLEDYGKRRVQVTEFDLRDALDAIVSGKAVPRPRTKPFGCAIVRRNTAEEPRRKTPFLPLIYADTTNQKEPFSHEYTRMNTNSKRTIRSGKNLREKTRFQITS